MYLRQRGIIPAATTICGLVMFAASVVTIMVNTYRGLVLYGIADFDQVVHLTTNVLYYLAVLSPFIVIGVFLIRLFPPIRVTSKGIYYQSMFVFFTKEVLWVDVDGLVELKWPPNCFALVITRGGRSIVKSERLGPEEFWGSFIGSWSRMLLIHQSLEKYDEVVKEIRAQINARGAAISNRG